MKILLLFIPILFCSCASIVSDSTYPVSINSEPSGQEFKIQNEAGKLIHTGTTPQIVNLKSGDGYFSRAHYTVIFGDNSVLLSPNMDEWYFGNLIFGGLIGFIIVDPLTGAMFEFDEMFYYPARKEDEE